MSRSSHGTGYTPGEDSIRVVSCRGEPLDPPIRVLLRQPDDASRPVCPRCSRPLYAVVTVHTAHWSTR